MSVETTLDAREPAAGMRVALSQAISFWNCQKRDLFFFFFQEEDSKDCSLDFPFQEKYEKIETLRKRRVPLSTAPNRPKSQHFCLSLSAFTSAGTRRGGGSIFLGRSHLPPSSGSDSRGKAKYRQYFCRNVHYFNNSVPHRPQICKWFNIMCH